jgi:glycosyltransferase involved in cell wall biosynthesis
MSLRVVQLIGAAEGADWFPELCARLSECGHEVSAVVSDRPGDLGGRLHARGIEWAPAELTLRHQLAGRSRTRAARYALDGAHLLQAAARMAMRLRRLAPDVVITHLLTATVIGRIAAALARVPVSLSMVPSPFTLEAPLTRVLDRATVGLDDAVIAGSACVERLYLRLGVPRRRVELVYYGADPHRFDPARADGAAVRRMLGVSAETPLIGHIAHFYAPIDGLAAPALARGRGVKGHEDLLEAARIITATRPDAVFILVGGARGAHARAYRSALERRAVATGLDRNVRFLEARDDIPDVLAALDVAVQCPLCDNLGGTIESLLMGVPTVATRVGGMPETVVDERTGLLVDPRDPAGLASAIMRLLDQRALARRLGAEGRNRMLARFTIDRTITDLDEIVRRRCADRTCTAAERSGAANVVR